MRLKPDAIARLDKIAYEQSSPAVRITRTDVIKAALAVAFTHLGELEQKVAKIHGGRSVG